MNSLLAHVPEKESLAIVDVAQRVAEAGGRFYLVGGAVRDALLARPVKDVDAEVFGLPEKKLEKLLRKYSAVVEVGKSFGVFKLRGYAIDVSLPRRERKVGEGHKGFAVEAEADLSLAEAAARRDFTINAMLGDPLTGEIHDPFDGQRDLRHRVLRHTSPAFVEDPLRVLRAMQFIARFRLTPAPETVELCRQITPENLPPERYFEEWRKLLLKGESISTGLEFLQACGWIRYFPELEALIDCPQDPEWHPEGDVWTHTLHCLDAFAAARTGDEWEDLVVGFAVLCHDFGKPATTEFAEGRWRSHGHEAAGEEPTRTFLARLTQHKALIEAVLPLVSAHLRPMMLYKAAAGDAAIRRLARDVGRLDRLARLVQADMRGRPPRPAEDDAISRWLLTRAEELRVRDSAPTPLVQGRHLIKMGLRPGRHFKPLLEELFEAQINGEFSTLEAGLARARDLVRHRPSACHTD